MTDRERQRQLDLLAIQFVNALEAGDFEVIEQLWAVSATDPEMETVFLESAAELARTYDAEALVPADADKAADLGRLGMTKTGAMRGNQDLHKENKQVNQKQYMSRPGILAATVLALVGLVAFLVWRQGQTNPTPTPFTNGAQARAPEKIELPKSFVSAVSAKDKDHAERLDKELAKLNDALKERAGKTQGHSESSPPVPPDAEKKLNDYQKWLEGDRKAPMPPLPLPPATPPARLAATEPGGPAPASDPASDSQWRAVAKQLLMVVGAAICLAEPELCPLVAILAQVLEIGDGETIYQNVRVLEGLQNAVNGKPFSPDEKDALKKFLTGPVVKLPDGKADNWIGLIETVNRLRDSSEKEAARQSLRMLDPSQKDPFLSALRSALDKDKLTSEDMNLVLAKLQAAGDGKYLITPERQAMLRDLLTRFGQQAVWNEIKGKLTTGDKQP